MLTSQDSLTGKVGKIIEIYNPNPWMTFGGMGSQKLEAPNIEYIVNNDTHPGAQFNAQFHSMVKNELARLAALDSLQTAQAKIARSSLLAKLSPPKDVKPTALGIRQCGPAETRAAKTRTDKSAQTRTEQTNSSKSRRPFLLMRRSRKQFSPMRRSRSQFLPMRF